MLLAVAACTGEPTPATSGGPVAITVTTPRTTPQPPSTPAAPAGTASTTAAAPKASDEAVVASLRLHPHEALATRGGVSIEVEVGGGVLARLDATTPVAKVAVDSPVQVDLRYIAPDGTPADVAWSQRLVDGQTELVVAQPWRTSGEAGEPDVVVAWQAGGDAEEYLAQLAMAAPVTISSPLTWLVTAGGDVTGAVDGAFVEQAQRQGIAVWPAIHGLDADGLHLLLADERKRNEIAAAISDDARQAGADGVNIDLEGFHNDDAADLSTFVEEISRQVEQWGGAVSYDLVPRSDSWDVTPAEVAHWSTAPQRGRLAAAVDYTVLMAYDQHNRFRPAGPVAAPEWVEEVLIYMLRYADPASVILGVPAYGRLWDPDALGEPRAVSLAALDRLDGERSFDDAFGLERIDLADGRFFWVDNEVTQQRVDLAAEYGLAGWAVWRLGLDHSGLWEAFPGPS